VNRFETKAWKILIADDEEDVHSVSRIVLGGISLDGRSVELYSAKSMIEAAKLFVNHEDFAVALIDIAMETNDAGLRLVQFVREVLNNKKVRLVIRTGESGSYPPKKIIDQYEINDFKIKSELSSVALYVTVLTALRNYRDLVLIGKTEAFLDSLGAASSDLFKCEDFYDFSSSLIAIAKLLSGVSMDEEIDAVAWVNNYPLESAPSGTILAATGIYEQHFGELANKVIPHIYSVEYDTYLTNDKKAFLRIGRMEEQNISLCFRATSDFSGIDFIALEFLRLKASEALGEVLKRRENNKANKDIVSNYYFSR
jgi:CheY-like chemotaxis protein